MGEFRPGLVGEAAGKLSRLEEAVDEMQMTRWQLNTKPGRCPSSGIKRWISIRILLRHVPGELCSSSSCLPRAILFKSLGGRRERSGHSHKYTGSKVHGICSLVKR